MNNRINAYQQTRLDHYQRVSSPAASTPAAAPQATKPASPAGRTPSATSPLSTDEQQMIQQYFPESPQLTLRLYGPNRNAQTLHPDALGSRLDVRG
jgi:hypothetical protein